MKVILVGSFPTSVSVYHKLLQLGVLQAVCFQQLKYEDPVTQYWKNGIQSSGLSNFEITKENIDSDFKHYLQQQSPDLVLVCGFGLKIPIEILSIPRYGFLNIHFGKLPQNRGADPVFWSLKNGDKHAYITVHEIADDWDTGAILLEQQLPIIPGETYGMVYTKLSLQLGNLIPKIIEKVGDTTLYKMQTITEAVYNKKPNADTTTINWEEQTAVEIEQLVNACNPKYGGATTYYEGGIVKIIEVDLVNEQQLIVGKTAGEIIHAHPNEGLFVYCNQGQLLRINVMSSDAGILSGKKYVNLGIRTGQFFTTK